MTYTDQDVEYVAMAIAEVDGVGQLLDHDCTTGYELRLAYQLKAKLILDEIYPKLRGKESATRMTYHPMGMVAEFHDRFDIERENSTDDKENLVALRRRLIEEECQEAAVELTRLGRRLERGQHARRARVALARKLVDILYVTYGTAEILGIPLEDAFEEVHRSNMSKLGLDGRPVRRHDGTIMTGPNYREADVAGVMSEKTAA
ncbi:hypothetical protein ACH427_04395 [Streptomyces sp. NPDC020379]|uniref:hypothetical protein n=1 Tax=Streptomyces sp. NPDC020379 TaxID=3365071 RepID=UPI0037A05B3C